MHFFSTNVTLIGSVQIEGVPPWAFETPGRLVPDDPCRNGRAEIQRLRLQNSRSERQSFKKPFSSSLSLSDLSNDTLFFELRNRVGIGSRAGKAT